RGCRVVSLALLLGLFFEREMVIELGTPHAMCLPDTAPRFRPDKCALSECSCPSALPLFTGRVCSNEARCCWITRIQSCIHLANSLFSLTLGAIWRTRGAHRPLIGEFAF